MSAKGAAKSLPVGYIDAAEDMMMDAEDGPGLLQFDKDGNLKNPAAERELFGDVLEDEQPAVFAKLTAARRGRK